ncbi:MAG: MlaD family protein [Solirubrobacteraceae bacterium]
MRRPQSTGPGAGRERAAVRRQVVGAAAAAAIVIGLIVLAFGRQAVTGGGMEVHAVFTNANQLKPGSAVRVAGLDIGEVARVGRAADGRQALVTLRLRDDAPTLGADLELAIRPRLAFEGNFYVDVRPGRPEAEPLRAGATIPARRTSTPVQTDEVLATLTTTVRASLRDLIGSLAAGLGTGTAPSPVPAITRSTGFAGLRRANRELAAALSSTARVSRAMRGTRPGDLKAALDGVGGLARELARDPDALRSIVTNYDRVMGVFAASERDISTSIRELGDTFRVAPAALTALDRVLPRVRAFSGVLRPVLAELPPTQRSFDRALVQLEGLTGSNELPRLVRTVESPVRALPELERRLRFLMPQITPIARCVSTRIVPVLNEKVEDGPHTIDQPIWQEMLHMGASLTGASSDFDANGTTIRAGIGIGEDMIMHDLPGIGPVYTALAEKGVTGVNPQWLGYGVRPPKRPDAPCTEQRRASLRSTPAIMTYGPGAKVVKAPRAGASPEQRRTELRGELRRTRSALRRSLTEDRGAAR